MAQHPVVRLLGYVAYYWFAILNYFLYIGLSIQSREFFRKDTEQDKNQYLIGKHNMT